MIPRITGVLETSLYVEDLDRAQAFYQRPLRLRDLLPRRTDVRLGVPGRQVCCCSDAAAPTPPRRQGLAASFPAITAKARCISASPFPLANLRPGRST